MGDGRSASRRGRRVGVVLGAALASAVLLAGAANALLLLAHQWAGPADRRMGDLRVYWVAVGALRGGHDLYDAATSNGLQFTYPPLAALLLAPMRLASLTVVERTWLVLVLLTALAIPGLVVRRYPTAPAPRGALLFGMVAFAASYAIRGGLHWGQVSVFLTALVVLDALYLPRRWQGVGTGVAAAFRVTPALLAVVALLAGRVRFAVVAACTAAGLTAAAAVVLPAESWRYWTDLLWRSGRVGELGSPGNQSLAGALTRWGLPPPAVGLAWMVVLAGGTALVVRYGRREPLDRAHLLRLLTAGGLLSEVLAPISWVHHWVWLPLAALLLYLDRRYVPAAAVAVLASLPVRTAYNETEGLPVLPEALLTVTVVTALAAVVLLLRTPAPAVPASAVGRVPAPRAAPPPVPLPAAAGQDAGLDGGRADVETRGRDPLVREPERPELDH